VRVVVPRMAMAGFDLHADVPPRRLDFRTSGGWRVGVLLHPAADGGTVVAAFGRAPQGAQGVRLTAGLRRPGRARRCYDGR
jgi:hypothetical protein